MSFFNFFFLIEPSSVFIISVIFFSIFILFTFRFSNLLFSEVLNYFFWFGVVIFSLFLCFLCNSPIFFIIFLEICVPPIVYLILNLSKDLDKFTSVIFIFCINILGSIPFIIFCYFFLQNFNSNSLFLSSFDSNFIIDTFLFFCFILVLVSKVPIVFFHFWLTKAHVRARGACSIILARLILKLGTFGIYKFFLLFILCSSIFVTPLLRVSLFGCTFFCVLMLRFFDLKFVVACSSILHISLIIPLLCSGASTGVIRSLFIMTGHGLVSYFLFYIVTVFYESSFNRTTDFNKSLESNSKRASLILFVLIFLNIGFPPFINFYRELMFCMALFKTSLVSLPIFCFSMLIMVIVSIFILTKSLFGKKILYNYSLRDSTRFRSIFRLILSIILLPFLF